MKRTGKYRIISGSGSSNAHGGNDAQRKNNRTVIILALIVFACTVLPCSQTWAAKDPAPSMRLHAIFQGMPDNKSAGDAVLLESDDEFLLMDTGLERAESSDLTIAYLKKVVGTGQAQKPLSIYISHYHGDHAGSINLIAREFRIDNFYFPSLSLYGLTDFASIVKSNMENLWENRRKCEVAAAEEIAENAAQGHVTRKYELKANDTIKVGGNKDVTLKIFPVTGKQKFEGKNLEDKFINNNSLATMVTCGKIRYLTAGDIEKDTEGRLVKMKKGSKISLKADIFKLDHHGLRTTSHDIHWANFPWFLEEVKPKISFVQGKEELEGKEKAETMNVINGKSNVWYARSFNAMKYTRKYGLCYNTTFEMKNFIIDVSNNKLKLYKTETPESAIGEKTRLKGISEIKLYYTIIDGKKIEEFTKGRYYIDPEKGYRTESKLVTLKENGVKHLFYISHTGKIAQKKRIKAGKYCYYFNNKGHAIKNQSVNYEGKIYYYGSTGRELTGKDGKVRVFK